MQHLGIFSPHRRCFSLLLVLIGFLGLTGCADAIVPPPPTVPAAVETVEVQARAARATATPAEPTIEPTPEVSPTAPRPTAPRIPSPSPLQPLAPPTPVSSFSGQTINVANLTQMRQLRQIGFGHALQTVIVPGDNMLAVATTGGIAWLELPSLQHLRFDAIDGGAQEIIFSRDGQRMAVVIAFPEERAENETIEVRQVADGVLLTTLSGTNPAFRADGQMIATMQEGEGELTTQLWSSADGQPFSSLEGGYPAFSPDGEFTATVQGRGTEQAATLLWRGVDGSISLDLPGDNPTFSPDGRLLATVTESGVQLWNMPDGRPAGSLDVTSETPAETQLAFTASGSVLYVFNGNDLTTWSIPEGGLLNRFEEVIAEDAVTTNALSTFGGTLAIFNGEQAGALEGVQLVRTEDRSVIFSDEQSVAGVVSDASFIAVFVTNSGVVRLVDLTDGSTTETKLIGFASLALSPDGGRLATATWGSDVYLWQVADGGLIQLMQTQASTQQRIPNTLSFFPNGQALFAKETIGASSSPAAALTVWDTQNNTAGAEIWSLNAANGQVDPARWAFNPATSAFAWIDTGGRVQLQQNDGERLTLTEPGSTSALAFTPDGTLIAVGNRGGGVQILKTEGGYIYDTLEAGTAIDALAFSPDGTLLSASQSNGTVLVWRLDEQTPVAQIVPQQDFEKIIFSADNQMLIMGGTEGVAFYRISDGQLARELDLAAQDIGIDPTGRLFAVVHDWRATLWGVP